MLTLATLKIRAKVVDAAGNITDSHIGVNYFYFYT